ncbi:hypothetical protein C8J57DRAFT_1235077 [Mycena rebaudengoi]|nr:hypothetical protein C8J57DRAFT_1235077 [Mycena rebaudengoi]
MDNRPYKQKLPWLSTPDTDASPSKRENRLSVSFAFAFHHINVGKKLVVLVEWGGGKRPGLRASEFPELPSTSGAARQTWIIDEREKKERGIYLSLLGALYLYLVQVVGP